MDALARSLANFFGFSVAISLGLELVDPDNPVRVVRAAESACQDQGRALEIYDWAGLPPELAEKEGSSRDRARVENDRELVAWRCTGIAVLDPGREQLASAIEKRVHWMFQHGLIDEVSHLRHLGYGGDAVVRDGIGYREAGGVLDGQINLREAISRTTVRTRQYAKRQRSYFRSRGWPSMTKQQLDEWAAITARGGDDG